MNLLLQMNLRRPLTPALSPMGAREKDWTASDSGVQSGKIRFARHGGRGEDPICGGIFSDRIRGMKNTIRVAKRAFLALVLMAVAVGPITGCFWGGRGEDRGHDDHHEEHHDEHHDDDHR